MNTHNSPFNLFLPYNNDQLSTYFSLYVGFYPFLNLPREAIESLWLSYNLIGEGWALQVEDLQAIIGNASYLADKLGITTEHGKIHCFHTMRFTWQSLTFFVSWCSDLQ